MNQHHNDSDTSGRFAYEGLNRIFHERARLAITTSLMSNPDGLLFTELKELCSLTDGNLSRHLSVLEEESMITEEKLESSGPGRPQTRYRLTETGRDRYVRYLDQLEQVLEDAEQAHDAESRRDRADDETSPGFSPAT